MAVEEAVAAAVAAAAGLGEATRGVGDFGDLHCTVDMLRWL